MKSAFYLLLYVFELLLQIAISITILNHINLIFLTFYDVLTT